MSKIPTGTRRPPSAGQTSTPSRGPRLKSGATVESTHEANADKRDTSQPKARATHKHAGPQAEDIKAATPDGRRRAVHDAITAALSDENVRYAPEQVSLHTLQMQAFAQGLPFLVLAHVPKYGPPIDVRPCSLWCSDEETEHSSQGQTDWSKTALKYQRSSLFVTQATAPHVIDMGILADLQDPAHPKRAVTSFLQLNEPQELQEPGRDWQLRAMASIYLASEHADTCGSLSDVLADAIPNDAHAAVYTDALLSVMADRNIKLALQCVQRGADLGRATDAGTTPLIEATLRAPIILLRRLLKVGIRPEHATDLEQAVQLAQNYGLHDRIALLQEHLTELRA